LGSLQGLNNRTEQQFARTPSLTQASVHALEKAFKEIRDHLAREMAAVPKARTLLQAARQQQERLAAIAANLPAHLPSSQGGGAEGKAALGLRASQSLGALSSGSGESGAAAGGRLGAKGESSGGFPAATIEEQ
jgi:hypothetical protein